MRPNADRYFWTPLWYKDEEITEDWLAISALASDALFCFVLFLLWLSLLPSLLYLLLRSCFGFPLRPLGLSCWGPAGPPSLLVAPLRSGSSPLEFAFPGCQSHVLLADTQLLNNTWKAPWKPLPMAVPSALAGLCSAPLTAAGTLPPPQPFLGPPCLLRPCWHPQPPHPSVLPPALPSQLPSFLASLNQLISTLISRVTLCSCSSCQSLLFRSLGKAPTHSPSSRISISSYPWCSRRVSACLLLPPSTFCRTFWPCKSHVNTLTSSSRSAQNGWGWTGRSKSCYTSPLQGL